MDLQGLRVQWMRGSQGPEEQQNHEKKVKKPTRGFIHVICVANRILAGVGKQGLEKHLCG